MEQERKWTERRRHPRYSPDRKNYPKVNFAANGAAKVPIDVVNISQGGMLGFTIKNDFMTENNHTRIKEIEIVFPGKLPFYCSGNLLRVHPTSGVHKCLCAIQFDEIGFDRNKKQLRIGERIENSLRPIEDVIIPDEIFINRLEKFDNYMKINDPKLGSEIRKSVYDSFDDITSNLSLEEKWYFFEMADELKLREPEYPAALKESFINLCRVGLEQSLKKANTVKKEIN
jgi:hypothetical protein